MYKCPLTGRKEYWRLLKPLYGLSDASLLFFNTIKQYLIDAGFKQSTFDRSCFINRDENILVLLYIDDLLVIGISIAAFLAALSKRFKVGSIENFTVGSTIDYCGLLLTRTAERMVKCSCKTMKTLKEISDASSYWTALGKLLFISTASDPSLSYDCSVYSRAIDISDELISSINKTIREVLHNNVILTFVNLGGRFNIVAFSDANNPRREPRSRVAYMSFFSSTIGNICNPADWNSKLSRFVCGSSTSAELSGIRNAGEAVIPAAILVYEWFDNFISTSLFDDEYLSIKRMFEHVYTVIMTDCNNFASNKNEFQFSLPEMTHLLTYYKCVQFRELGIAFNHTTRHQNLVDCMTKKMKPLLLLAAIKQNKWWFGENEFTQGQRRKKA